MMMKRKMMTKKRIAMKMPLMLSKVENQENPRVQEGNYKKLKESCNRKHFKDKEQNFLE